MFFDVSTLFADEELPRQPQQKRSKQKQRAIFEATADLFAEKGYNATNTKEIAERAGVSIGTLYFNFKDKRQILLAMLAEQVGRYAELEEVDSAAVRADPHAYLLGQLKLAFPYNRLFYSIADAVRELAAQDESLRQRLALLRTAINGRIYRIIDIGQQADMTHPWLDTEDTAQVVTALIFNLYAVLPNPSVVSAAIYWRRHAIACKMICRMIFKDAFVNE